MQQRPDARPLEPIAGGADEEPPPEIDERRLGVGTGDTADSDATVEEAPSEADQPATGDPTGTGRPVLDDHHVERDQHDGT